VLELLLFFGIPQRDTNPIAHELLNTFGSFSDVLDAPYEELVKIKGMTQNAATLLKLLPCAGRLYDINKSDQSTSLNSSHAIIQYVRPYFKGKTVEEVYALYLDNACNVKVCKRLIEGQIDSAPISIRKIIETAIASNCVNVILAHNHPFGLPVPSTTDLNITKEIGRALKLCELRLLDHVIISPNDAISMSEMGYYNDKL